MFRELQCLWTTAPTSARVESHPDKSSYSQKQMFSFLFKGESVLKPLIVLPTNKVFVWNHEILFVQGGGHVAVLWSLVLQGYSSPLRVEAPGGPDQKAQAALQRDKTRWGSETAEHRDTLSRTVTSSLATLSLSSRLLTRQAERQMTPVSRCFKLDSFLKKLHDA